MTTYNGFTFTNLSSGDTLSDPDGFTNPSNAMDDNDVTYADLTTLSAGSEITKTLGTTFTTELIKLVRVKASIDMNLGSVTYAGEVQLQGYNGSTWIKLLTLGTTTSQVLSIDTLVRGNFNVQGLRIAFISTVDSGNNIDMELFTLSYGNSYTYTPKFLLEQLGGTNLEDLSDRTAISEDHTKTWLQFINKNYGDNTGGSVSNSTTETDLATITIPQNDLGDNIEVGINAGIKTSINVGGASITFRLYVDGSIVDTQVVTNINATVAQNAAGAFIHLADSLDSTAGDIIIKVTAQPSTAAVGVIGECNGLLASGKNSL